MAHVKAVYYLDILSSWCLVAEDALARVRDDFGDRLDVEWRIAASRHPYNYTPDQLDWYYRRTESITGVRLNSSWLHSTADGSRFANLAAEAARTLGADTDRVRLALSRGAMLEARRVSQRDVAVDIAAAAGGLDRAALDRAVDDPAIVARIQKTTKEFEDLRVDVRPTFVVRNGIGDSTVLSGCWRHSVLSSCISALLDDEAGYESFIAHNAAPAGAV